MLHPPHADIVPPLASPPIAHEPLVEPWFGSEHNENCHLRVLTRIKGYQKRKTPANFLMWMSLALLNFLHALHLHFGLIEPSLVWLVHTSAEHVCSHCVVLRTQSGLFQCVLVRRGLFHTPRSNMPVAFLYNRKNASARHAQKMIFPSFGRFAPTDRCKRSRIY